MNRSSLHDFAGLRGKSRHRPRMLAFEPLEERRLLTADNLLIATYDDSAGKSVVEYSDSTGLQVAGGAYTGNHGLGEASGIAVAPDGSYYVSNLLSGGTYMGYPVGQVLHFSSSGQFLNVLGANDAVQAPLAAPGTLAFGPNGNLYVADLGTSAIYQFDLDSTTQQYQAADTISLPQSADPDGFTPGGFTFADNATHDLIVGNLQDQSVWELGSGGTWTPLILPGSGYNPLAILALSNGNLLIADSDLGTDPAGHHQIVEYDSSSQTTSQFINLTTPMGTEAGYVGNPPQPTSLMLDTDGNLLVGLSPDHNGVDGAVEKFNISTGTSMGTVVSGIGTPSGLALAPVLPEDLIVGTYDNTAVPSGTNNAATGDSVIRFNTTSQTIVGGAATGDQGLGETSGIAVAPDGSYYVSNLLSGGTYMGYPVGQVLHFSSSGQFLNVLGANDAVQAPLAAPGTLAFGPNGNLYVADLGTSAIYQFDLDSTTQQYQAADTISLPQSADPDGFTPGGFTFADNATHDLIVGNLQDQSVWELGSGGTWTPLILPGSGYNPLAILALSNGNLLIADSDLGTDPAGHHQIVEYDSSSQTTSQFINLTTPMGTEAGYVGNPPQPTSLMLDTDGNLLVGLSPDHNGVDGAVEKFNISTGAYISTVVSTIGSPAGLAFAPVEMVVPASAWTNAGLTLVETGDGKLHVYTSGTTTDVVAPNWLRA